MLKCNVLDFLIQYQSKTCSVFFFLLIFIEVPTISKYTIKAKKKQL